MIGVRARTVQQLLPHGQSFLCLQLRADEAYNNVKWPIGLVYLLKPLLTAIRAIVSRSGSGARDQESTNHNAGFAEWKSRFLTMFHISIAQISMRFTSLQEINIAHICRLKFSFRFSRESMKVVKPFISEFFFYFMMSYILQMIELKSLSWRAILESVTSLINLTNELRIA